MQLNFQKGAIAISVANPTDLMKVRLQSEGFLDNIFTHLLAGLGAGFFVVCIGSPLDVMPRRPVKQTHVPAPTGPGSSEWPIAVAISSSPTRENPSDSDSSDSERPPDVVIEETLMPPPPIPSFVPRDIPGSGPRPRWVRRDQSPEFAAQFDQVPIAAFQGISAPSPEVRACVRALTQMVVERVRSVDRFISSVFRAVQYQDLVNWLVFELGSIGGSVKPPEFKGEVDPVAARICLKEMEKAFTLTKEIGVLQNEAKFTELARIAPEYVSSEAQRAKRFQQGLKPEIRSGVVALELKTYTSVVQAALVIESDQKLAAKEQGVKKRKFESGPAKSESGIASRKF
ncbi:hypothetical protein AgCh_011890 [Apium graveolens]